MSRREAGEAAEVRGKYLLRVLLNGLDHGLYICLGLGLGHAWEEMIYPSSFSIFVPM